MNRLILLLITVTHCGAQTSSVISGAGYTSPAPVRVAPGQVLTVIVSGRGASIKEPLRAHPGTLPLTLGSFSAVVFQGIHAVASPIVEVRPLSTCPKWAFLEWAFLDRPCGRILAVTLQIPFEIAEFIPGSARPEVPAQLVVSEAGVSTGAVDLDPRESHVHVLTGCDVHLATTSRADCPSFSRPIVTRADGSQVSPLNPAKPGEIVVMYAYGLGRTDPAVASGVPSPMPAPLARVAFDIDYTFGPNAFPVTVRRPGRIVPYFVGLSPGSVGLYQINFAIPTAPTDTPPCSSGPSGFGFQPISSNLTISVARDFVESVGICVDVTAPVQGPLNP
jgi:uncharacterized protein (TIGR03437 family)